MGCEVGTAVGEGQVRAGGLGLCQGRGQYCRLDASRKAAGRRWRRPGGAGIWGSRNPTPVCSGPCSSPVTESSFMPPPPTLQHQGGPQSLWWWLGLQKEVADCVTPREWCPQGTGSRREGADLTAPLEYLPLLPGSPCSSVPGVSLSLATLVDNPHSLPQHQTAPQHLWGLPLLTGHHGQPWQAWRIPGLWKCRHFLPSLLHVWS